MTDRSTLCSLLSGLLGCAAPAASAPKPIPDTPARQAPTAQPEDLVDEVAAGARGTCIRTVEGRIACWGEGVGSEVSGQAFAAEPIALAMPPATHLVAGESTWCAVTRDDGEVWCWGNNEAGELGRATATSFDLRPGPVAAVKDAVDIVRRGGLTCARTDADATWCWGLGSVPTRLKPRTSSTPLELVAQARLCIHNPYGCKEEPTPDAPIELPGAKGECTVQPGGDLHCLRRRFGSDPTLIVAQADSLSVGPEHACAVGLDGLLWCLGEDEHAQTGGAELVGPVRSVSVGNTHSCALTDDRRVMCWGSNERGQVGRPAPARGVDTPTQTLIDGKARALVRFGRDICVQTDSGVSCPSQRCETTRFESTEYRRFAKGPHGTTCLFNPGGSRSCTNGTSHFGGDSPAGRGDIEAVLQRPDSHSWCINKGRISTCEGSERLTTDGTLSGVSTDYDAGCGLTPAGALRCFMTRPHGAHAFPGPFEAVSVPDKLVRRKDGRMLWLDTDAAKLHPMPVVELLQVSSEGLNRTCGIDPQGQAWCWRIRNPEPERIEAPVAFTQIELTTDHACAIAEDGTLWCWGDNDRSQLGHGAPKCARSPVDVTDAIMRTFEEEASP